MEEITIRKYKAADRASIRKICCDTAFMGEPVESFFNDRKILADLLTLYYTDYEPESVFVAEDNGQVIGYLLGCKDTIRKEKVFSKKIFPKVLFDFLLRGLIFDMKSLRLFLNVFKSLRRGEFNHQKVPVIYPAHLHIDIEADFRKQGLGTRLMDEFFKYLRENNITGVHLCTFSEQGRSFFLKVGFNLLWEIRSTQWRYLINRDVLVSTFAKKI
ncbi:MAG: GNAT family N-acetyltransferase [Candidatus Omnitrophica bacterium]|nr:GNAT family N-acetyltransferase [Candidatus Omnitrophota bacterium]